MRWKSYLSSKRLVGLLSTRSTVEIEDDIQTPICRPPGKPIQLIKSALGEVLAVCVDE